ncbi:MAG: type IV secretory system conjugative DNA transfer family protein [Acetobacteraceae bacterium]
MQGFWLGYGWDLQSGRKGKPVIYSDNRHVTLFGPTRSGKGVSIEIPNLLRHGHGGWFNRRYRCDSILSIDPKAQNCAVTMKWRSRFSTVWVLNPLGALGIPSTGFNPLLRLDANAPRLFDQAKAIAEVLIVTGRNESQPHFADSARSLLTWLIMWEVIDAARKGRVPSLAHVRDLLTEPVETATDPDGSEYEVKGLRATAGRAVASGDPRIMGLAGRFVAKSRELDGIVSTADTQTSWLMSAPMREDISVKDGADFSRLRREPITCYVCLPAHELEAFNPWLKLVVSTCLNTVYEQAGTAGHRVTMMLSEYAQLASGGELKPIIAALGQGAGYGVQLAPIVLQDINQLRARHGRDQAETFLGMSGATFAFAPNDGQTAEWMSARSGDRRYAGLSASDDPKTDEARMSYQEKRERLIPPDAMYGIPPFHGLVWFAGCAAPQPVYAPPYWEIPELRGRYSRDPYHQ